MGNVFFFDVPDSAKRFSFAFTNGFGSKTGMQITPYTLLTIIVFVQGGPSSPTYHGFDPG